MATVIYLTTADDIVTDIAALVPGDTAHLAAGTYNLTGNLLNDGVTIIAAWGVILKGTGNLFVGTVTDSILKGYADIHSGTINITADTINFEVESISTTAIVFTGGAVNVQARKWFSILSTEGQVSFQAQYLSQQITHVPGTDYYPATFDVQFFEGAANITSSTNKCMFSARVESVIEAIGEIFTLDECYGTVYIGDCKSGNSVIIGTVSTVKFEVFKRAPSIEKADASSKIIVSGSVINSIEFASDVKLEDFVAVGDPTLTSKLGSIDVQIGKNVSLLNPLGDILGTGVSLIEDQSPVGTVTSVTAGNGLVDNGTPSDPIINLVGGPGLDLNLNNVEIDYLTASNSVIAAATDGTLISVAVADRMIIRKNGSGGVQYIDIDQLPVSAIQQTAFDLKEDAFSKNSAFNKNFGTSGSTVAYGNHNHSGVYEPAFSKSTAFNKNFGVNAGTVLEGDTIFGSDDISNESTVPGSSVSDALESLDDDIVAIQFKNYAHLITSTTQNMGGADLTEHIVDWDGTAIHTGADFTAVSTKVQVGTTGRYSLYFNVGITQGGTGRTLYMSGYKINNGTTITRGRQRNYSRGSAYGNVSVGISTEVDLSADDYIEAVVTVEETDGTYTSNSIVAETELIMRFIE